MEISVIIVNYNVCSFLEQALNSCLKASHNVQCEIIVVDNNSDDGSCEIVKEKFPSVKLICNEENFGFAKANNIALKEAKGEFILLLNPDTIIEENTFDVMINFFHKNEEIGLAGCKVLNPDGTLQLACRRSFPSPWVAFSKIVGLANFFPNSKFFSKYNLTYLSSESSYEVDAVSGSFMFFRKKVYEQVGGLDEVFFMYGEDLDFCYRVKKNGWKNFYVADTQIIHFKGESTKRSSIDEIKFFYESMEIFVRKHFMFPFIAILFLEIGITLRLWFAILNRHRKNISFALCDAMFSSISVFISEYFYRGKIFSFPNYAYPIIYLVPIIVIFFSELIFRKISTKKKLVYFSIFFSYIFLSALTFFFKEFAFSRIVMLLSGIFTILFAFVFRFIYFTLDKNVQSKKTLIVGISENTTQLISKIANQKKYNIIGLIDFKHTNIGKNINGTEIVGCVENLDKVISKLKVESIIFSQEAISNSEILSLISQNKNKNIKFLFVPKNLNMLVGKSIEDSLYSISDDK